MRNFAIAVLLGLLCFTTLSFGQATDSNIVGTVMDASGAAVQGATVTATNRATGVKSATKSSADGAFRFNNVLVGSYDVQAQANGFTAATVANVQLQLNRTSTVNFRLEVGQVTTTVEVAEAAAAIDTSTAQLQSTFENRQAVDLPQASSGSGVINLSLLVAGASSGSGAGYGTGPSIGGQRPTNNSFNVEGVDNNDKGVTGPILYVPNDAVGQFSILQNQFSPEFGGSSGGIFNTVLKGGTNDLHGSIYEYLQNRNLNAVDASSARQGVTSNPRYDQNRLGATIGGAVIKNKLFYFGDFEYNPLGNSATPGQQIFAPTAAGYSTLNGLSGISKTNLKVLQTYLPAAPAATASTTVAGVTIPTGPISVISPNYSNQYNAVIGVDYTLGQKDQLRGRYIYNNYQGIDIYAALPVFFTPVPDNKKLISLAEFHNFSATLINEFRASYSRRNNDWPIGDFKFPGLDAFPNIQIDQDLQLQLGPDPNSPQGYVQNLTQFNDNVTKSLGKHTLKFGYDFRDIIASNTFVQRARGDYDYSNLNQYLMDLSPDELAERSVGAAGGVPAGFLSHAAFVNDDFRIRPNLTLNIGVRYEYVTVPVVSRAQQYSALANVPGVITFGEPKPSKSDWAPRVGLAWSPGNAGVWSIRGGFGLSYDNTYNNLNINAKPAFYQTTVDIDPSANTPNFLANGGIPGTVPPPPTTAQDAKDQVAAYTYDQVRPYAINYTLSVERMFAKDYTLEARYVGTKAVHLYVQDQINKVAKISNSLYIPTYTTMPSASTLAGLTTTLGAIQALSNNSMAQYGFANTITAYHPIGNSRYNGLALQLTKRYSNNFSYVASYTLSKNMDDSTATVFSTYLTPRRGQDFKNLAGDWATSALDRRNRFTFSPIYDWQAFQSKGWMMKNLVSNWNLSFTYTFESPEYATVQSGLDSNLNGDSAGDRAVLNANGTDGVSTGVTAYNAAGQAVKAGATNIVAYVANNSNARYISAALGAKADAPRNTIPMAHINNFDASITKKLTFKERYKFEVGGQFFNLFNHAQFVPGYISDVAPQSFTTSRNFLIPGNSQWGQYDQFFNSHARNIQVVARIVF